MYDLNRSDSFENGTFHDNTLNIGIFATTILLVVTNALANLGIIIAFWKIKAFGEKPSEFFILVLACVNLFLGMVIIPLHLSPYILLGEVRWIFGEMGCQCYIFSAFASVTNGPLLTSCICLDRLLLVKMEYPRYVKSQSKTKVLLTVTVCFILALTPATADLCFWEYSKSVSDIRINYDYFCLSPVRYGTPEISLIFLFVFVFCPIFLVSGLSVAFLHALRLRLQRIRRVGPEHESSAHSTAGPLTLEKRTEKVTNRYLKPAMTLGALVLALAVAFTPYICYVVIIGTIWPEKLNPNVVFGVVLVLYCKSIFDPVMYAVSESKIRKFYVTRFRELKNKL